MRRDLRENEGAFFDADEDWTEVDILESGEVWRTPIAVHLLRVFDHGL
jgi:hypothetical protein